MGRSLPSKSLRESVCSYCPEKCEKYDLGSRDAYFPRKSHEPTREYWGDARSLHIFCKHRTLDRVFLEIDVE